MTRNAVLRAHFHKFPFFFSYYSFQPKQLVFNVSVRGRATTDKSIELPVTKPAININGIMRFSKELNEYASTYL